MVMCRLSKKKAGTCSVPKQEAKPSTRMTLQQWAVLRALERSTLEHVTRLR